MKNTKNILILNLAISNVLMCIFNMPLTLVDLITSFWPLGVGLSVLCPMVNSSQSAFLYFSSFSVVLIAVDRYIIIIKERFDFRITPLKLTNKTIHSSLKGEIPEKKCLRQSVNGFFHQNIYRF